MENILNRRPQSIDNWEPDIMTMYSGSDRKEGLLDQRDNRYLIKYPREHVNIDALDTGCANNIISEYVSSHILGIIGFPVHETSIRIRSGEPVVVCKNFVAEEDTLSEFGHYARKHFNPGEVGRVPEIGQFKYILDHDPVLRSQAEHFYTIYWERFIGDALIGNFDRHTGNWGYIVHRKTRTVSAAPIYDNGSTLYPALSEKAMAEVLHSPKEIAKRTFLFPKAALIVKGKKASYLDMLTSDYESVLSDTVRKIVPKIQTTMPQIHDFINGIGFLSDTRKKFYITMLDARTELLLLPAYKCCIDRDFDGAAYERLHTGIDFDDQLFSEHWSMHQEELEQKILHITEGFPF